MHDRLVAEPIRLTWHDFCALPDDGRRYEILDGELFISPSPMILHQRIVGRLHFTLAAHVEAKRLGEVFIAPLDVLLSEYDIVEPDVIFVSEARRGILTEANIRGVPDLLIEVLSPSRPELDTRDKRQVYERCGVPFYWMVDAQHQRLIELQLADRAYAVVAELEGPAVFRPRLFPELAIPLERIWA